MDGKVKEIPSVLVSMIWVEGIKREARIYRSRFEREIVSLLNKHYCGN